MLPGRRELIAPAVLASAWLLAALAGWPSPRAMPTPGAFAETALRELGSAKLWLDAAATTGRVLAGLSLSVPAGAFLGLLLGRDRRVWAAVEPTLDFARSIPPILSFPLFLLALGYGEGARAAAIAAGTAGIVALHVGTGLSRAPVERADAARLAGLGGLRALVHLHVFEALPSLFTGTRVALATALVIAVVSEMLVGAGQGLGARALEAQLTYRPDQLWLVIALTGAIGLGGSWGLSALERRLVRWPVS